MYTLPVFMSVPLTCLMPMEARGEGRMPWNWSYRCLLTTLLLPEIEAGSSERAGSVLHCWAISPASESTLLTSKNPSHLLLGNKVRVLDFLIFKVTFTFINLFCVCACTVVGLLLPGMSRGSNSGSQTWQQEPLPVEHLIDSIKLVMSWEENEINFLFSIFFQNTGK